MRSEDTENIEDTLQDIKPFSSPRSQRCRNAADPKETWCCPYAHNVWVWADHLDQWDAEENWCDILR